MKIDGVLELCDIGPLDVTQRRASIHDATVAEILQCHQIFRLAQAIQIPVTAIKMIALEGKKQKRKQGKNGIGMSREFETTDPMVITTAGIDFDAWGKLIL